MSCPRLAASTESTAFCLHASRCRRVAPVRRRRTQRWHAALLLSTHNSPLAIRGSFCRTRSALRPSSPKARLISVGASSSPSDAVKTRNGAIGGLFGAGICSSLARTVSCTLWAAARPNTTISRSEFEPSRLAPCTEAQAASPNAINPVTTSLDVAWRITSASLAPSRSCRCCFESRPILRERSVLPDIVDLLSG